MLLKDIKLPFINKIKVYAFVGPSGQEKVIDTNDSKWKRNKLYYNDDGLLIKENEVIAGESAKKAAT